MVSSYCYRNKKYLVTISYFNIIMSINNREYNKIIFTTTQYNVCETTGNVCQRIQFQVKEIYVTKITCKMSPSHHKHFIDIDVLNIKLILKSSHVLRSHSRNRAKFWDDCLKLTLSEPVLVRSILCYHSSLECCTLVSVRKNTFALSVCDKPVQINI